MGSSDWGSVDLSFDDWTARICLICLMLLICEGFSHVILVFDWHRATLRRTLAHVTHICTRLSQARFKDTAEGGLAWISSKGTIFANNTARLLSVSLPVSFLLKFSHLSERCSLLRGRWDTYDFIYDLGLHHRICLMHALHNWLWLEVFVYLGHDVRSFNTELLHHIRIFLVQSFQSSLTFTQCLCCRFKLFFSIRRNRVHQSLSRAVWW